MQDPVAIPSDDRAIVLYDGECSMCRRWSQRLRRWDRGHRLVLLSLHDPSARRRFPDLDQSAAMRELHVCDPKGGWHVGANALRYLARKLPQLWWAVPVVHFPFTRPIWRWWYTRVAADRYGNDCELHGRGSR